ncbi:putative permease [Colletotrichum siamense]|uniref:putative permease n=1 Tax=Colletotrichum siamense TaxID=690259 RepID=UPI0018731C7E|nr:putative permease [Colletotrichum siamense]KAF5486718.1 putative permease [Colletotrichum siamense]
MGIRQRLELRSESAELGTEGGRLSNKDMDPIPMGSPERTWGWPSLLGFWIAEAFSISMYQVSSTSVTKGLNPGLAILAVFIGHVLVCIPAMLDGYVGCVFGINFPVFTRASFGLRGAHAAVFVRGVVACIWFGTQSFQGGQCLQVMIAAIWPSFNNFPNHLPASAHVTSAELLCFFLFIIVQLPLLWLHVSSLRYMFMAKTIIMPIFGLTLFIWALVAAKGFGPTFSKPTVIKDGTPAIVVFFQCVTSAIGPKATLALNMPDFTRYAKEPRQVFWTQAVGLIVLVTMCGVLGATVSSASEVIYGEVTWNPLEVARLWNNRAAQFFAGLCWAFAVIGTNISANSVSFSNDLSLWFPKYVNNRRGAYVCAILGVCAVPWNIQYSAKSFSSFLGGYSLFLGAIAGVIVTDFWICRGRQMRVSSLYDPRGTHFFTFGVNPRAIIAFIFAIVPNMPGLAAACGAKGVPKGATYLYSLSWLVSTLIAGFTYWACWKIRPFRVDEMVDELSIEGQSPKEEPVEPGKSIEAKQYSV